MTKQTTTTREDYINAINWKTSEEARAVIIEIIENDFKDYDEGDFDCYLSEKVEDYFIYYADAWDYMKNYGDDNLEEFFKNGIYEITDIARRTLEDEISLEIYKIVMVVGRN